MQKQVMLLVEDSALAMQIFHEIFDEEYLVVEAYNGEEALAYLKTETHKISVILLDIVMPQMSGLELLEYLSKDTQLKEIPIVAVTSEPKYQVQALELGAWDYIPKSSHRKVIEARVRNVIERSKYSELKNIEEQLRLSESTLRAAIAHADMHFWVYDMVNNCALEGERACREYHIPTIFSNYPQSWVNAGYMLPEYADEHLKMHQALRDGAPSVVQEIEVIPPDTDMPKWLRIQYTNVFDEQGKPLKAFGTAVDITEQKLQAERYNTEIAYREQLYQNQHVYALSADLNANTVVYLSSNYPVSLRKEQTLSYDEFQEAYSKLLTDVKHKQKVHKLFSRKALINSYNQGNRTVSYDFKYTNNASGKSEWMNTTVTLIKKPETGHITAFAYTKSIADEKIVQSMMHTIIENDYDCVLLIDATAKSAKNYGVGNYFSCENIPYIEHFESYLHEWFQKCCVEKDVLAIMEASTLSRVIEGLQTEKQYTVTYSVYENGRVRRKQDKYSYTNKEQRLICYTRYDITEVWEKENEKNEVLEKALAAAERANVAKSDFLSKMSHEIRTPMNAIIGMAEVVKDSLNDEAHVKDCISKIEVSSRYLLSLINDILDMSRIESGNVILQKDRFLFADLVSAVNLICVPQARAKDLEYICKVEPDVEEFYVGDMMKLQQICINIIANAVKFTPTAGKVCMHICQKRATDQSAVLCFRFSDTGCGIDPDFIPLMFDPFSQEKNGRTSEYGGTGLGLSICKNLVSMMDGKIDVQSTLGIGTEFVIEVTLGRYKNPNLVNDPVMEALKNNTKKVLEQYPHGAALLSGRRILLAEDHPLNTEIATKLLNRRGILVEHAKNGQHAIDLFENNPNGYYDAVLMDIRMPVVDGLAAAEKIRKSCKEYASTIPIIAMTANAFDEDIAESKNAGMNAHLTKPIEPEVLFSTLQMYL